MIEDDKSESKDVIGELEEKPTILDNIGRRVDPKLILMKDPEEEVAGYVAMQGAHDSGIACIAMAARTEYQNIAPFIPRNLKTKFKGVPGEGRIALQSHEMLRILYDLGILARQVTCLNLFKNQPGQEWRAEHANAIYEYDIHDLQQYMMIGGKAILGVPSKEDQSKLHWVYMEGMNVFDPYPIKADRYNDLKGVLIADAIIVGGVPGGAQ
jgi:hypothetical protein